MFTVVVVIWELGVRAPVVVTACAPVTVVVALMPPAVVVITVVAVGNGVFVIAFVTVKLCAVVGAVVFVKE